MTNLPVARGISRAWAAFLFAVTLLAAQPMAQAAGSAPGGRARLLGHRTRAAATSAVLGRESASAPVDLTFALRPRDPQGLADFAQRVSDPADPLYGHYLTPGQFAARFSPTPAQYARVAAFARAQGMTVTGTTANRLLLHVTAPSATVEQSLAVHLQRLRGTDGATFRAPDSDPALPVSIASLVTTVAGLDTSVRLRPHLRLLPFAAAAQAAALAPNDLLPQQTGSGPGGGLTPSDIKTAYNLNGAGLTGSGQTLALFELDGYTASDVTAYEDYYHLPHVPLENVLVDGYSGAAGDGAGEVTLDIELQAAIAPGVSKIIVYEGPNVYGILDTYNQIAVENRAKQISTSWGLSEAEQSAGFMEAENTIFQQMAAQGQTIFAASGDSGAYDNRSNTSILSADDPAAQPYMTGVGGTSLTTAGAGGIWQGETTWNGGGGGISVQWPIPAWQQGVATAANKASAAMRNVPDVALDANPYTGYSIVFNNSWYLFGGTSCAAPLWAAFTALVNQQRQANGNAPLGFANPTIYSLANASNFHDIADGSTNQFYPAVAGYDDATGWGSFNGANLLTTLSGPPALQVSNVTVSAVTTGSATVTWTTNLPADDAVDYGLTPSYGTNTTGSGSQSSTVNHSVTLSGLTPGMIYHYRVRSTDSKGRTATGADALFTTAQAVQPTILTVANISSPAGQTVTLSATLTSGGAGVSGRPLTFQVDGVSAGIASTDVTGAALLSYAIPVGAVVGSHTLAVSFAGDASDSSSSGTGTLTVSPPLVATSLAVPAVSGSAGQTVTLSATLKAGAAGLSGKTVSFSIDGAVVGTAVTPSGGKATLRYLLPSALTLGSHTLVAAFAGDSGYRASSGAAILTVGQAPTKMTIVNATGTRGKIVKLTARLRRAADSAALGGEILSFSVDGAVVGTAVTAGDTGLATLSYTIPAGATGGTHSLLASFAGDSGNTATSVTGALTVN